MVSRVLRYDSYLRSRGWVKAIECASFYIYIYIYCLAFDCIAIVESGRATSKGH
jgi:hypothetical protein